MACGLQRRADRADAPVHHVGGRDDVRAGFRIHARCVREQRQRGVVVHRVAVQHPAVPVAGVLAEADVGDHGEALDLDIVQSAMAEARSGLRKSRVSFQVVTDSPGHSLDMRWRRAGADYLVNLTRQTTGKDSR